MSLGAAVLTFREGLEAALIVAILLGYLRKIERPDARRYVLGGVALALAVTLGFVAILQVIGAEFEDPAAAIYEGTTSLLAVAMVTDMTFWMARHGRSMKGELEGEMRAKLARGSVWGLCALAFITVIREGIETGLFLSAATFASSGIDTLAGGLVGLAAAIAVAWAMYVSGARLNLGKFFRIAGLLLVVFGAAILRYGVHEFEEVGVIPPLIEHVWNIQATLPEKSGIGAVLQALVGYTAKPSLTQLIAYTGYFVVVGLALWKPWRSQPPRPRPNAQVSITGSD
ncbi:MAG TPA: FTR1 family protein [Nitrolancea sp.]|nr:FTR1 family protein [Nitrolancea sp.]